MSKSGPIRQSVGLRKLNLEKRIASANEILARPVPQSAEEREEYSDELHETKENLESSLAKLRAEHDAWVLIVQETTDQERQEEESKMFEPFCAQFTEYDDQCDEIFAKYNTRFRKLYGTRTQASMAGTPIQHRVAFGETPGPTTSPQNGAMQNTAGASSPSSFAMPDTAQPPPVQPLPLQGTGDGLQSQLAVSSVQGAASPAAQPNRVYPVKAPRLSLPSFNGDVMDWQQFWAIFSTNVHERPGFSKVEKFSFLVEKLEGKAKQAIKGLIINEDNYDAAVDLLKQRFDRAGERMIGMLYSELRKMYPCGKKTGEQRSMLDTCERIFRQLQAAGEDIDSNRALTVDFLSKFPPSLVRYIQSHHDIGPNSKLADARAAVEKTISKFEATDSLLLDLHSMHPSRNDKGESQAGKSFKNGYAKRDDWDRNGNGMNRNHLQEYTNSAFAAVNHVKRGGRRATRTSSCYFCGGNHYNGSCTTYRTAEARKQRILDTNRCLRCLRFHPGARCWLDQIWCYNCKERNTHASALCPKEYPGGNVSGPKKRQEMKPRASRGKTAAAVDDGSSSEEDCRTGGHITALNGDSRSCGALFQTAKATIVNPATGESVKVRLGMDTLSSRNYVTDEVVRRLGLTTSRHGKLHVDVFGLEKPVSVPTTNVDFDLTLKDGTMMRVSANTTKVVCRSRVIPTNWSNRQRACLKLLKPSLADDPFDKNGRLDVLVGTSLVWKLIDGSQLPTDVPGLNLLPSKLGLMLTGEIDAPIDSAPAMLCLTESSCTYPSEIGLVSQTTCIEPNYPDIDEFWRLESIGIKDDPIVNDDDVAVEKFQRTVQFKDGRYQVQWPWIEEKRALLPSNYDSAFGQFCHLAKRLNRDPELLKAYRNVIRLQVERGIVEKVPNDQIETDNTVHYLPHHPVIKLTSTTTKVRIVNNASSKSSRNDLCLNDCLLRGPVILPDLCQCLMRLRVHDIVVVSDIEKAFLQVGLQPSQRDATRFLWLENDEQSTIDGNVAVYRFARVNFGVISSPFLLAATIQHHLGVEGTAFAESLRKDIYVDNVVSGLSKSDDPKKYYLDLKELFKRAGMNIQEFCSNSSELMDFLPARDAVEITDVKVLGMKWDSQNDDTIRVIKPSKWTEEASLTKREVLRAIASVFDPLGLFQPVMLPGKLLLQRLWEMDATWDDVVDDELQSIWNDLRVSIDGIFDVRVPRFCGHVNQDATLAVFSDASAKAYSATVYLRTTSIEGNWISNLILSKSRLAPCNKKKSDQRVTLPRLELLGAVIAARAAEFCREAFGRKDMKVDFFIDSECVLHWIRSRGLLKRFVARRVEEISKVRRCEYHYVATGDNPADLGTRGKTCAELQTCSLWWHGPSWLTNDRSSWPQRNVKSITDEQLVAYKQELQVHPEQRTEVTEQVLAAMSKKTDGLLGIDVSSISRLQKLVRITAICMKFVKRAVWSKLTNETKSKHKGLQGLFESVAVETPITCPEYSQSEGMWIRAVQSEAFEDVLDCLLHGRKHHLIQQLGLTVSKEHGLIQCEGRHQLADVSESAKRPILLPRKHQFTDLVVQDVHERTMHSGVSHTLSQVRQRFWIPQGRMLVRSVLGKCLPCKRFKTGKPFELPPMPPWPVRRMQRSHAFEHVGLDYFGPINVKIEETTRKMWVCLFTCLTTRAVHLESVMNCSAHEFLNCLIRFVSRRGVPSTITSDNAAQFRLTKLLGDQAWKSTPCDEAVISYAAKNGIQWKFIVELAPWQGGFYERLVGVVKNALRMSIRRKLLKWTDLVTLLAEAEAVVNSRPITYVSDDVNSWYRTIRPCDFLIGSMPVSLSDAPDGRNLKADQFGDAGKRLVSIWRQRMRTLDHLWKVWYEDYLLSLRETCRGRHKGKRGEVKDVPERNEVVLVHDADLPRANWKLALVTDVHRSKDGHVRSAEVKLPNGIKLRRSIKHLIPLEVESPQVQDSGEIVDIQTNRNHRSDHNESDVEFEGFSQSDVDNVINALQRFEEFAPGNGS